MAAIRGDLDLFAVGIVAGIVIGALLLVATRFGVARLQPVALPLAITCATTVGNFRIRSAIGELLLVGGALALALLITGLAAARPGISLRVHRGAVSVVLLGMWVGPPETDFAPIALGASLGLLMLAPRTPAGEPVIIVDYGLTILVAIIGGAGYARATGGALGGLAVPILVGFALLVLTERVRSDRVLLAAVAAWHVAVVSVSSRAVAAGQAGERGWPAFVAIVLIGAVLCSATVLARFGPRFTNAADPPA